MGNDRRATGDHRTVVVPSPDEPMVSIVVSGWRKAPTLLECLRHLEELDQAASFEVVLALNAPDPELTRLVDEQVEGAIIASSTVNTGFAGVCNRGVAASRGRYLALLNDDAFVEPSWLGALTEVLEERPEVGAVGSRVLNMDGSLQEAGAVLWSDATVTQVDSRFALPSEVITGDVRPVDHASACALLVRRSCWERVGGMDEMLFPAYYEDVDLCLRLAASGAPVYYQPRAVVRHRGGESTVSSYRAFMASRNQATVLDRWRAFFDELPDHPDPPESAEVLEAIARTEHQGATAALEASRVAPPRQLGSEKDYLAAEVSLLHDYATNLEDTVLARERSLSELHEELAERVLGLEARLATERRFLSESTIQVEMLAAQLDAQTQALAETQELVKAMQARRAVRAADKAARVAVRLPGGSMVARRLYAP